MPGIEWIELTVKQSTMETDDRNMKMNKDQETHPTGVNARYNINWANRFLKEFPETPFPAK